MKFKIIKKLLSTLLITASLATPFSFASAMENNRQDLNAAIKKCDDAIADCQRSKLDLRKQKDTEITSIRQNIDNNLKTLKTLKQDSNEKQISIENWETKSKDFEKQNEILLKKIASVEKKYQENIKITNERYQQQLNEKNRIQDILHKLDKEASDLVRQIKEFREECCQEISGTDQNFKDKVMQFENTFNQVYASDNLKKEDIDEYTEKLGILRKEFKWQQINSGSQSYNPVKGSLCWLHSATNVLNYYNNMDNKGIIKGSRPMVDEYKKVVTGGEKNIDGAGKEFDQIVEYLNKCQIGTFHISFAGGDKQKVMDTAKELLKTHFKLAKNQSPVICHKGIGINGHYITIADHNEKTDEFLIVDSGNNKSFNAKIEWQKSKNVLESFTKTLSEAGYLIEMEFTSKTDLKPRLLNLVIQANKIIQTDLFDPQMKEEKTSIQKLNNIIMNY